MRAGKARHCVAVFVAAIVMTWAGLAPAAGAAADNDAYDKVVRQPDGSISVGKYLFVQKALLGLRRQMHIGGGEVFSPALQDRFMKHLVEASGLNDYVAGKISAQQFQHGLAVHFASFADPATGKSLYGMPVAMTSEQAQAYIAQFPRKAN